MQDRGKPKEPDLAPVFIIADDDRSAVDRILGALGATWFLIPVTEPGLAVRYAQRMGADAVFLADPIDFPKGGARRLLQKLLDEVGKPVVVLSEDWSLENAERWKRIGAQDCLPHPTRLGRRLEAFRTVMEGLALATQPACDR